MNGIIVWGRVEICSILKVCDSDDRLLSVTHQQGAGGACLRNETKVKALNPFVSERACTWHFTLIASQIQLGNKRHKCNILKQPAHSSWKAPVASSLAPLAGSRWCWGGLPWAVPLIYPFLPACYKVFRGKPRMHPLKRDYSTSNSHDKCLSGTQVFITLMLVFLLTSHKQWWKSLEWYPRRQLHWTKLINLLLLLLTVLFKQAVTDPVEPVMAPLYGML